MDASNGLESFEETTSDEIKSFFASSPPLKEAEEFKRKIEEFMQQTSLSEKNRKIVLVTSGGTTVPLEQRCVRYIDNFSSGHRGAASAEYFLKAGYAVVFLYRVGTCQPFCRSLPNNPLLECFDANGESNITALPLYEKAVKEAISSTHEATSNGSLLKLPFTTIFEYLQILQLIASSMTSLGSSALFCLAAAVSDFYVPWESMAEHKIQSSSGPLNMQLAQVPKMLSVLRKDWAPKAFCISFKDAYAPQLETDKKILLQKAGIALKKYNMDMVVANELLTRKEEVIVVAKGGNVVVQRDTTRANADVEEPLIKLIVDRHSAYIGQDS